MAEFPFQPNQALNVQQNRALALAAVFQATQLTHMTAMSGQQSIGESGNFYFELLVKASLNIRPTNNNAKQTLDFFNQLADISLGLKTLEGCITQPFNTAPKSRIPKLSNTKLPMSYAMALLQLEKRFIATPNTLKLLKNLNKKSSNSCLFSITTICIQVSLPVWHKHMLKLLGKSIHVFSFVVMLKHLKILIIPIESEHVCLRAYNWRIYGDNSVVVHGRWFSENVSC